MSLRKLAYIIWRNRIHLNIRQPIPLKVWITLIWMFTPRNNHRQAVEIYPLFPMGASRRVSDDGVGELKIIESFDMALPDCSRYLASS